MRILLLTQDDPFYLAPNIDYLLRNLPPSHEVVGCCLFDVSPFGRKERFFEKAKKTFDIFGAAFFVRYSIKFLAGQFDPRMKVEKVLAHHGVPLLQSEGSINSAESLTMLRKQSPDLLISIAGNQIFKKPLIELAPNGCLNLHTALLPRYRGLMPSFWVMKNDEKLTGVSVFFVDEGIDSGPILVQEEIEIGDRSLEQLIIDTKKLGMDCIIRGVQLIEDGQYTLLENDPTQKSYYSFPARADVEHFRSIGKRFF